MSLLYILVWVNNCVYICIYMFLCALNLGIYNIRLDWTWLGIYNWFGLDLKEGWDIKEI